MMSKSKWKRSLKSLLLGGVVLIVISLSFGCGDTATSSDLADGSFVESAPESSPSLVVGASASSLGDGPPDGRRGQGPPEEALAACADTSVGESCSFTGPNGDNHDGTCSARPDDSEQVVCRPDDWAGRDRRDRRDREGPPAESLAACSDAASGAECSFEAPFGSVSGTCEMPPVGDSLACRPTNRGR